MPRPLLSMFVVTVVALLFGGVASAAGVAGAAADSTGAGAGRRDSACGWPAPGRHLAGVAQAAFGSHRLLLLGEKHGTREIPCLVGDLIDALATRGPVRLALELPRGQQERLDALLASRDDASADAARAALLADPWWRREPAANDGRRSHDVLDLLMRLRASRLAGRDVRVVAFDVDPGSGLSGDARDAAMADAVRAAHEPDRGHLLVLTGNVHAMTALPEWAPPQMPVPMGSHLRDLSPLSLDIVATDGAFHACAGTPCGPVPSRDAGVTRRLMDEPWDARVVLPRFTPARLVGDS